MKIKELIKGMYLAINPAAKAAAEQQVIKERLISGFGEEKGEALFEKAKKLSTEKDLSLKEAAQLVSSWGYQMSEAAEAMRKVMSNFGETMANMLENMKVFFADRHLAEMVDQEKRIQVLSIRKQKSQAKNWSKWKKRGKK